MIDIHITITGDKTGAHIRANITNKDETHNETVAANVISQGISAAVELSNETYEKSMKPTAPRAQDSWVQDILDELNSIPNSEHKEGNS